MNIPTIDQLKRAVEISERIAALESEMSALLHGQAVQPAPKPAKVAPVPQEPVTKKRKMSAAGRARIAASAKARWAKVRDAATPPAASPAPAAAPGPKKQGISPAHKAKLAAAAKRRWARIKAGEAPNPFTGK